MPTMQESLNAFSERLLQMQDERKQQKIDLTEKEKEVFAILESAVTSFDFSRNQRNDLEQSLYNAFDSFQKGILKLQQDMESRSGVRKALENLGDGLIVVVFGRTNAGKSTLGNFLRGKQLAGAAFPNAWKNGRISPSPINIVETATGSEINSGEMWFKEGSTETTREAQVSTLPGLLWLDTPGFGSMNDAELGALARKYVSRTDLVVYLDHSDNPGLRDITDQLIHVLKEGRRTLILINQSDRNERVKENGKTVFNKDGEPLRRPVPKSAEDRQKQEAYLVETLQKKLPDQKDIHAISISTKLAIMAVENPDAKEAETQYQGSNMDAFFAELIEISKEKLKYRDAVENCTSLIDNALGSEKVEISLKGLDKTLADLEESINRHEFKLEEETKVILNHVMNKAQKQLDDLLKNAETTLQSASNSGSTEDTKTRLGAGKRGAVSIDINPLIKTLAKDAKEKIQDKAKELLEGLWFGEALTITKTLSDIPAASLYKKTKKHQYEVFDRVRRDPKGVWETFCSWFGKKYFRYVPHMETKTINLGVNTEEVRASLNKKIENELSAFIHDGLESIHEECLVKGSHMIRARREALAEAVSTLETMRKELKKRLSE